MVLSRVRNIFYIFDVYPNPADQVIHVIAHGNKIIKRIGILDLTGRVLSSDALEGSSIATGSLDPNLYLIRIETTDNMCYYEKFIKR